ncbi:transposase [Muribaculum intestinale]|uniref:transposase n=1 Tax=Muribaculum intestinale TaxID=1796646 RepID=UPI0039790D93
MGSTTVAVIDSQSVRTGLDQSVKGIDGGKKINGIKRHLAVDLNGFPLTIFRDIQLMA